MHQSLSKSVSQTAYERISIRNRTVLQKFLDAMSVHYAVQSIRLMRQACTRFLLEIERQGIQHIKDIDNPTVETYFQTDQHASIASTKEYRHYVERFLLFYIQQGILPEAIRCTFRDYSATLSPLISSQNLEAYGKSKCFHLSGDDWNESMQKYRSACDKLSQYQKDTHYGLASQHATRRYLHTFEVFLRINGLPCSDEVISLWLSYLETVCTHEKFKCLRHAVLSVYEIMLTNQLYTRAFYQRKSKYPMLDWQSDLLDEYKVFRERTGCAPSTWRTISSACARFFVFINQRGLKQMDAVDGHHLKDFHSNDTHLSFRGKNLYTSQLRLFLEYLALRGIISEHLPLALSCTSAPTKKLVSTLSPNEVAVLYEYRESASSPMELRDTAFFLLGLRMGFRGADIAGLRISDISWREQTISLIQKKTGVFLKLPMPVDVGNSIYRYLKEGRPKQADNDYAFVRHMAPYCNLSSGREAARRLEKIMRETMNNPPKGFHITRRTFASGLLKTGSTVPVIAAALGHTAFQSVNKYLSTDEENLRRCAISMNNIEYKGQYNL